MPAHADLTTQQAAELLNVSRRYLIKLLDGARSTTATVGTHRRIKASSLMEYRWHDDAARRKAADESAGLGREMELDLMELGRRRSSSCTTPTSATVHTARRAHPCGAGWLVQTK